MTLTNSAEIARRAADIIESGHWAGTSLRSAFSFVTFGSGRWPAIVDGGYPDYIAIMEFERHWIGERQHRNDGLLISETAGDRAARVPQSETVEALRSFASA